MSILDIANQHSPFVKIKCHTCDWHGRLIDAKHEINDVIRCPKCKQPIEFVVTVITGDPPETIEVTEKYK